MIGEGTVEDMVTVTIRGERKQFEQGTSFEAIAEKYQAECGGLIAVAAANGKIRELFKKVTKDCQVDFFTLGDAVGYKNGHHVVYKGGA